MAVDGDSGIGVITPVEPGIGTGISIAEPLKYTLLPLSYYARILGINPVHFQGATGDAIFPVENRCSNVWPRYSWQNSDQISHEDLARSIYDAEQDITRILGYSPAPMWFAQEVHRYPRHYRQDLWRTGGGNVRQASASIQLKNGKLIQGGQRNTDLIGTATTVGGSLNYTDEDGDGFAETATVTIATALTDARELKVYHTDMGGAQEWEIRRPRSKTIVGANVVMVFDSWLFINPDTQSAYPTIAGFSAIDVSTVANYVTSVEVHREWNDFTQTSSEFYWEPRPHVLIAGAGCTVCSGTGCPACELTSQTGCLYARNNENGIAIPVPASYDEDTLQWDPLAFSECRDPDQVKVYYYAGEYDDRWLAGFSQEPLSNFWAHTIAWLATARLERPFCSCGNVQALSNHWREDLSLIGTNQSHQVDIGLLSNPLGTRRGEVMAWQRIGKIAKRIIKGGAI